MSVLTVAVLKGDTTSSGVTSEHELVIRLMTGLHDAEAGKVSASSGV